MEQLSGDKSQIEVNTRLTLEVSALQAVSVQLKEKVLIAERALLYVMGFDTDVVHPYTAAEEILAETEVLQQVMAATDTGELQLLTDFMEERTGQGWEESRS